MVGIICPLVGIEVTELNANSIKKCHIIDLEVHEVIYYIELWILFSFAMYG